MSLSFNLKIRNKQVRSTKVGSIRPAKLWVACYKLTAGAFWWNMRVKGPPVVTSAANPTNCPNARRPRYRCCPCSLPHCRCAHVCCVPTTAWRCPHEPDRGKHTPKSLYFADWLAAGSVSKFERKIRDFPVMCCTLRAHFVLNLCVLFLNLLEVSWF